MAPRSSPSGCNKQQLFNLCVKVPHCFRGGLPVRSVLAAALEPGRSRGGEVAPSRDSSASPQEEGRRSRAWGGQAEECEHVKVQKKETCGAGQRGIHLGSAWCWHSCLGTGRLQGPAQRGTDSSRVAARCWVSCHGQSLPLAARSSSCPFLVQLLITMQLVCSWLSALRFKLNVFLWLVNAATLLLVFLLILQIR